MNISKKLQVRSRSVKLWTLTIAALVVVIITIIVFATATQSHSSRTEQYKAITGAAGLRATISYDCTTSCEQKYDFNVYILNNNGQQVNVVRPDKEGKVNAALSEGEYVMLIGKRFGNDKVFPQEPLALKNGQELELKLHYK